MRPLRVVIIDDAAELRLLLRRSLCRDCRFEVVGEGASGTDAVEQAGLHRPDVMVLDIAMPDMDGLEAIPRVLKASPGTRILVLSGFTSEALARQALEAGAHRYVPKGTGLRDVADTLVTLCEPHTNKTRPADPA